MDTYVTWRETSNNMMQQKHITQMSMLLNTAIIGKFNKLSTFVNLVQYTVVKAILF